MNHSNSSNPNEWTYHEDKKFENAIAELDHDSPNFFENINAIMPWKSISQIKSHYEKLIGDIEMIERGEICSPNYDEVKVVDVANDHKRRGAPWTDEEHRSFLIGLNKLGKGEWRTISSLYVPTKTPSQVACHGQKYFRRLKCGTPVAKRRHSIHDVRILDSSIVETSARQPTSHSFITEIPRYGHPSLDAPYPDAPPQQETIIDQQQYNITNSSWAELAKNNNNNPNDNINLIATSYNLTSNINNNTQMMMGNDINNYLDYNQSDNYDNFCTKSPYMLSHDNQPSYK